LGGLTVVGLVDGLNDLVLGHAGAAVDVQPFRDVEEVSLRTVRVDAADGTDS
jgi:hypothetical protein